MASSSFFSSFTFPTTLDNLIFAFEAFGGTLLEEDDEEDVDDDDDDDDGAIVFSRS